MGHDVVRPQARRGRLGGFTVGVSLSLAMLLSLASPAGAGAATARAAHSYSLTETGHLHKTSGRGITINQVLNEEGSASGTISGTIYIHLRVVSVNHVSAEVNIYPSGGSISGDATASYRSAGAVASFTGTMGIDGGTGRYDHAHGSNLTFTGTIERINDAVAVHVTGRMST